MKTESRINLPMCAFGVLPVLITVALVSLLVGIPLEPEIRGADLISRIGVVLVAFGASAFTSFSFCSPKGRR